MDALGMDRKFISAPSTRIFRGKEKMRDLANVDLNPRYCILDETDSGLDIDALKEVSQGVNRMESYSRGFLVITHYQRLLEYIVPDRCIMCEGRIVLSGDKDLALELENKGDWIRPS